MAAEPGSAAVGPRPAAPSAGGRTLSREAGAGIGAGGAAVATADRARRGRATGSGRATRQRSREPASTDASERRRRAPRSIVTVLSSATNRKTSSSRSGSALGLEPRSSRLR